MFHLQLLLAHLFICAQRLIEVSSVGSSVTVLNGGISRSLSSSSMPYASSPYIRNGSDAEPSLPSSLTRELGAQTGVHGCHLQRKLLWDPLTTLPQPFKGINGFVRRDNAAGRQPHTNSHGLQCKKIHRVFVSLPKRKMGFGSIYTSLKLCLGVYVMKRHHQEHCVQPGANDHWSIKSPLKLGPQESKRI